MKTLMTTLIGMGAGAIVFLAFLALQQQQEVKQDLRIDKAKFELENATFDKTFEEKWQAFDGKPLSQRARERFDARIQAAERELAQETERLKAMETASDKTLAEMREALEALDKPLTRNTREATP